jgi:hypothetical protein
MLPLRGLATATTILLGVSAAMAGLAGAFFLDRAGKADDFLNGNFLGTGLSELDSADSRVASGIGLFFFAFLATGVVFIIWQFRHAKNAEAIRGSLSLGPGWAIGGWFIPLANWILPALQIGQSAKASDPDLPAGATRDGGRLPGIIVAWAITYALGGIVFFAGSSSRPNENDVTRFNATSSLQDFARADRIAAVGMFIYAIAAVLAIVMIRTLTQRQDRAAASMPQPQYPQQQYPQQQPYEQPGYQPQPGYQQPGYQQPQPWQPPPPPAPPPPAPPPPSTF